MKNKRQKSVMKHKFSQVPQMNIQRSNFNRSHGLKTAFSSGWLIPIYCDEALPGDTFNVKLSSVARLATPLLPFMDNLFMDVFYFSVPNRLLWDNWQRFMGERDPDPDSSTDYQVPQTPTVSGGFTEESLADYMGLPILRHPLSVNALHFRAYNLIYNSWFRSESLQDSVKVDKGDGPDLMSDYVLLKRGKRHDYFTSALPFPQVGDAIDLPLGTQAPIATDATATDNLTIYSTDQTDYMQIHPDPVNVQPSVTAGSIDNRMFADLTEATGATINSLREAFQLQKMLEKDARGGNRYTELLRNHFSVVSPDSRLQRPEYLGGGSTAIQITPIAQTSETSGTEQGKLTAIGYASQSGIGFTKSFVEHCTIIGLVSVRADLTYQNCLNRMWTRQTKHDYYWPSLAHLGEQEILNQEIHTLGTSQDTEVWGYQERWSEYRYFPSQITGKLRSISPTSLDAWHLSQDFGDVLPLLNSDFIEEEPPIERVTIVTTEPEFIFDSYFNITATRPMPTYSVPGLIDHF